MNLLIQSAMIFFGTLMAAAVVALGEPARSGGDAARSAAADVGQPVHHGAGNSEPSVDLASTKSPYSAR